MTDGLGVATAEILRLAELASLELSGDEAREAAAHLERLLAYVQRLRAVDVDGVPELTHVPGGESAALRPDVARPGLPRERILAGAPAAVAGLFEVPKVIPDAPGAAPADAGSEP